MARKYQKHRQPALALDHFCDTLMLLDTMTAHVQLADGRLLPRHGETLTSEALANHYNGKTTLGSSLVEPESGEAKAGCVVLKLGVEGATGEELADRAKRLRRLAADYGLTGHVEHDGHVSLRFWLFSTVTMAPDQWTAALRNLCFMAQIQPRELYPDPEGAATMLPLGRNKLGGQPSFFFHGDTVRMADNGAAYASDAEGDEDDGDGPLRLTASPTSAFKRLISAVVEPIPQDASSSSKDRKAGDMTPKLEKLDEGELPSCIRYLTEKGVPDDVERYKEGVVRVVSYGRSHGLSQDQTLNLCAKMARATPTGVVEAKIALKEREAIAKMLLAPPLSDNSEDAADVDALPAWSLPDFSCSLIRNGFSLKLLRNGGCRAHFEPCWPLETRKVEQLIPQTPVEDALEREVIVYTFHQWKAAAPKILQIGLSDKGFRGRATSGGPGGTSVSLNQWLWKVYLSIAERYEEATPALILLRARELLAQRNAEAYSPRQHFSIDLMINALGHYLAQITAESPVPYGRFQEAIVEMRDLSLKIQAVDNNLTQATAIAEHREPVASTLSSSIVATERLLYQTGSDLITNMQDMPLYYADLISGKPRFIETPSSALNYKFNGGFQVSRLYALGAPPKEGKSAFIWWLAQLIAGNGKPVIFFTYEMPKTELLGNALARLADLDSMLMEQRPWSAAPELFRVELERIALANAEYNATIARNLLVVDGNEQLTGAMMRGVIAQFRSKLSLEEDAPVLVMVDSIQRVPTGKEAIDNGANETAQVSQVVVDLKRVATAAKVAVVAISEITKKAFEDSLQSGHVTMECFRGSFKINHVADVLMVLQSRPLEVTEEDDGGSEKVDQLKLYCDASTHRQAASIEKNVRDDFPLNVEASATYARLTVGRCRGGKEGDCMFVYEKAKHHFVPMDMVSYFGK